MFKDYYEARAWLEEFIPLVYGKEELGLTRIEYLLKLLGNPENKFKSIHIAGTSGKGSTAFYTVRLLQEAGSVILGSPSDSLGINSTTPESFLFVDSGRSQNDKKKFKVGLHVSPHLTYIGERMRINGKPIEVSELIRLMEKIRPAVESMKSAKVGPPKTLGETRPYTGGLPSYFEILVAASFVYFAREKVDYAVVEVGLGGRLDATNVLVPEISIITNIGLDHTEILGKTISAIAGEKSGIIKVGVPVVTGASGKALRVIEMTARKTGSKLIKVTTQKGSLGNQILAKTALETLGIRIGDSLTKKVFERGFEGRFEKIEEDVILDGAHNPDKIRALIRWIKETKENILRASDSESRSLKGSSRPALPAGRQARTINSVILVLAFKKGKKWKKMIDLLVQNLPIEQVIATGFSAVTDTGKFSAVPVQVICDYLTSIVDSRSTIVKKIENSQEATVEAINAAKNGEIVLVCGSLYLVGEVRTMWNLPEF